MTGAFKLLVFGSLARNIELGKLNQLVTPWFIPHDAENRATLERSGIPETSFFLIRPDVLKQRTFVTTCQIALNSGKPHSQ